MKSFGLTDKGKVRKDNQDCFIIEKCRALGVNTVLSTVWAEGGKGGEALAREVVRLCEEEKGDFKFSYELDGSIEDKITAIVTLKGVFGAEFSSKVKSGKPFTNSTISISKPARRAKSTTVRASISSHPSAMQIKSFAISFPSNI